MTSNPNRTRIGLVVVVAILILVFRLIIGGNWLTVVATSITKTSPFSTSTANGGCHSQLPLFDKVMKSWTNITHLDRESALIRVRPANFLSLPSFDHDLTGFDHVNGGVAHFTNALVQGKLPPAIYDCSGSVYVPGGCKSYLGSNMSFVPRMIGNKTLVTLMDPNATTVFIWQYWGDEYYHSQVEVLPRLAYVLPQLHEHHSTTILGFNLKSERLNLFSDLLGLGENVRWIPYNNRKTYHVANLLVPTCTRCGRAQPKAVEIMQQAFDKNAPTALSAEIDNLLHRYNLDNSVSPNQSNVSLWKPLIVLQRRLLSRKLLNHDELLSSLNQTFGHKCAIVEFLGNENAKETAALHRLADVIIGPHGAGLANLIYCQRGKVSVVELHPPRGNYGKDVDVNRCHEYTARAAGLQYVMIHNSSGKGGFGNFVTDVETVLEVVEDALRWLGKKRGEERNQVVNSLKPRSTEP